MESKTPEETSGSRPTPVYMLPCTDPDDEISLVELWRILSARKNLLFLAVFLSVALAAAYSFLASPVYKAEALLLPPQPQDIQALMIKLPGKEVAEPVTSGNRVVDPEVAFIRKVYTQFLNNLRSRGVRRAFFDTHELAKAYSADESNINYIFSTKFNDPMRVVVSKKDPSSVAVSLSGTDPDRAAQWLNQFIDFANQRTVHQLYEKANAELKAETAYFQARLASKLQLARHKRYDRITRLKEALRIASELGIETPGSLPAVPGKPSGSIVINAADTPLYMRGSKAIEAEIAVLETRKSEEPFIDGLRDLQENLLFLKNISIDRDSVSAVTVDSAATAPYRADKPRKKLILALAVVFGLMSGIFLVIVAELRSKAHASLD